MKKKKHIIAKIDVTPRKGVTLSTSWLIERRHPNPNLVVETARLAWRNDEGILPRYKFKAEPSLPVYNAYLLAEGVELPENCEEINREHFAGYNPRTTPQSVENPGSFSYRGCDLGEIIVRLESRHNGDFSAVPRVRGHQNPTPSEAVFLRSSIVPALEKTIKENETALSAQATARLARRMRSEIARMRHQIAECENKIPEAIHNYLRAGKVNR